MKRSWSTVRTGTTEGSEAAALALAQIADEETIRSFIDSLVALERFGGELYVGAYRKKFDAHGQIVEPDEVGEYETVGLAWHYEHVAKLTRGMTETSEESEASVSLAQAVPLPDNPVMGFEQHPAGANGAPEPEPAEAA